MRNERRLEPIHNFCKHTATLLNGQTDVKEKGAGTKRMK
jgi:hypothetical protein